MKRSIAAALLLLMTLLLTGCSLIDSGEYMKQTCTQLLDAIIAGDADAAYALMSDSVNRADFDVTFGYLHSGLKDVGEYKLRFRSLNKNTNIGTGYTTVTAVYKMKCDKGVFQIEMEDNSSTETLEYFNITQLR